MLHSHLIIINNTFRRITITPLDSTPQRTGTVGEYILLATMWTRVAEVTGHILPPLIGRHGRAGVDKLLLLKACGAQPPRRVIRVHGHSAARRESVGILRAVDTLAGLDFELHRIVCSARFRPRGPSGLCSWSMSSWRAAHPGLRRVASTRVHSASSGSVGARCRCWKPQLLRAQHPHAQRQVKE